VGSSQALFVAFSVQENVVSVHLGHAGHAFIEDVVVATIFSTLLGGEVGMAAGSVPVTLNGLGLEVHIHAELFSDATENELGQPHVVTAFNTTGNTNLVLPLAGSHFTVDTCDFQASIDHAAVGAIHDFTAKGIGGTHTTVILALGLGKTILWPSIRTRIVGTVFFSHEELLFYSEPRVLVFGLFHDFVRHVTEIETGRSDLVMNEGFTKHQEGVAVLSEWIFDHTDWLEPDFRVTGDGHLAGRSVEGPPIELLKLGYFLFESFRFRT